MSNTSLLKWMGLGQSGKSAQDNDIDKGERCFGLQNFGNTCYCNSVLQALYHCKPFRQCVMNFPDYIPHCTMNAPPSTPLSPVTNQATSYFSLMSPTTPTGTPPLPQSPRNYTNGNTPSQKPTTRTAASSSFSENDDVDLSLAPGMEDTLFLKLKNLFYKMETSSKKCSAVSPVHFIDKLKKKNELFRSSMHQDAHEFLNYLLNTVLEDVQKYQKTMASECEKTSIQDHAGENGASQPSINSYQHSNTATDESSNGTSDTSSCTPRQTWIEELFGGIFSNETRCLTCETVTSRDECFMDLSIDVEMNSSITSCLRQFSASETLCHKNKYYCDVCCGLQEAERRMKIRKPPNILALHLKRFKYQEQLQKYIKLTYRVVFPFELRLFNTCDDTEDPDRMYELWACVIHIGSGPHHGHYVTVIKCNGQWKLFDDDSVSTIQEEDIQKYFSDLPGSGSGYVLFYQAVNLTADTLPTWNAQSKGVVQTMDGATEKEPTIPQAKSRPLSITPSSKSTGRDSPVQVDGSGSDDLIASSFSPDLSGPLSPSEDKKSSRWGGISRRLKRDKEKK